MLSATKSTRAMSHLLFYLNFAMCLIGTSPSAPATLSTKNSPEYYLAKHRKGPTKRHLMCIAYPRNVDELHEISFRKPAIMPSISLRGGSAMDEESSTADPSESSSFPIEREENVVAMVDTPDSEIEIAPAPPDSTKVRCYTQANMYHCNVIVSH
jgi:hypothetical protein